MRSLTVYAKQNALWDILKHVPFKWISIFKNVRNSAFLLQVKTVPANTTEFRVPKLKEGHDYMFRVKAENRHGESSALVTEESTKAKNPFSK